MNKSSSALIITALIMVMVLWGGSFIAIKIALRDLTPAELTVARFVPSAALLLPLGLWAARKNRPGEKGYWASLGKKERVMALIASFLAVPGYHFCLNYGETLIPAGWASLVISLNPACIVIFSTFLLHETIGLRRWGGIGLALAGLLLIALTHKAPAEVGHTGGLFQTGLGLLITLGAVVSWGGFTTLSKKLIVGREPLEGLGWTMTMGALWTLPLWRPSLIGKFDGFHHDLAWAVIFLSVGCTVIGFAVWFWALAQWPASRAGAFIYLVPLFALIISRVVLSEPLDLFILLGALVVLGGVILAATAPVQKHQTG